MSIAFIKWLVTRAAGVSAISLHDPGKWSTSHYISHWWIVLIACVRQIVMLSFSSKHEQKKKSCKNFENVCIY